MNERQIYATKYDYDRLEAVAREARGGPKDLQHVRELRGELGRANVVDSKDVPADVVTMNSKVRVRDVDTGEETVYTLVFPADADMDADKVSVLAPIGTAILGYRAGSTVEWAVPAGTRRLKIEEVVYQPEAAGDLHL